VAFNGTYEPQEVVASALIAIQSNKVVWFKQTYCGKVPGKLEAGSAL